MKQRIIIKRAAALFALILAFQCFCFAPLPTAAAGGNTVFLNQQTGNDAYAGDSATLPKKNLNAAIAAIASEGGTVVITGQYDLSAHYTEPAHAGAVTFTSVYGGVDYRTSGACLYFASKIIYRMSGEGIFKDININYGGACVIAACYNPVTFDTGVNLSNYEAPAPQIYLLGGYEAPGAGLPDGLDSHITIKSGSFSRVAGFNRTLGTGGTYEHMGTAYIDVSGGTIENLFCANLYNHYAKAAVLTVTGGAINKICTGGDVTRRIETASVYLYGGSVGQVDVNNVTGDAFIYLYGSSVTGPVAVRYEGAVADLAQAAGGIKHIFYNGLIYSSAQVAAFTAPFDTAENISVLYVTDGGSGSGFSQSSPAGSFAFAMNALAENGGCLMVVNRVTVPASYTEPSHAAKIAISGSGAASELYFGADPVYTASGETAFEGLTLSHAGQFTFNSQYKLTFGRTFYSGGSVSVAGKEVCLYGGSFDAVTGGNITVDGAEISSLHCADGGDIESAAVEIVSGRVDSLVTARNGKITGSFSLHMGGGTLSSLALNNLFGGVVLNLGGGTVGALSSSGCGAAGESRILYYGGSFTESMFSPIAFLFDEIRPNEAVYIANGGSGDGKTASSPIGSLYDAVAALPRGGTVVVCAPYTVETNLRLPAHSGPITLTSRFGGADYSTFGASLIMNAAIICGGSTTVEFITLKAGTGSTAFYGCGHPLKMGYGIETLLINGNATYPAVCGGDRSAAKIKTADVTINSGTWYRVRAGTGYTATISGCDYKVTINGGVFNGFVCAAGFGNISGSTSLTINGGTFYQSIYLLQADSYAAFTGSAVITINGGAFYGKIAASNLKTNVLNGAYSLYISGGDFAHVTDITGSGDFGGSMDSKLYAGASVDINAAPEGTYSFTNYLRPGADPWMFTDGKNYYLTVTGGSKLYLRKAASIGDLAFAAQAPIFIPEPDKPYSLNLWSPEIHYLPADVVGEANAGWYLYFCANQGDHDTRRMFVLKCLTDDLQGEWGHPTTGEVNVPEFIVGKDDDYINSYLAGGMSPFTYGGELYTTWMGSIGRGQEGYCQVIYINKMENPWTLVGMRVEICRSEYAWEMHGYGKNNTTGVWYPKVVEGASAVKDDDGNLYIIYTGSGYWTVWYALGQLKFLGGDLCNSSNWLKLSKTSPIFSKSSEINGCGHGSYFTDLEGQRWISYHAYTGTTTDSGRFVFVEPYEMTANGMVIGNGSGKPAPLNTVYTLNVNSAPVADKLSGFEEIIQAPSVPELGDADFNGEINNRDAAALLRYLAGAPDTNVHLSALDINGDGRINNKDAAHLLMYLAGFIDSLK